MSEKNPYGGKDEKIVSGQSVGNCSDGAPQPQASEVVEQPDCRMSKPLSPGA
jgi:hypothetical protein